VVQYFRAKLTHYRSVMQLDSPLCRGLPLHMDTSLPQPETATGRRICARYPSSRPLPRRLCGGDSSPTQGAWILNLSTGGVGLLLDKPLPVGALLFIELETCPEAEPLQRWASVVNCLAAGDGEHRLGCQFLTPLDADDLHVLLQ
jgi:hypothetical protein